MRTSKLKPNSHRRRDKSKFIGWNRKIKIDGRIRYTFMYGDNYWVVNILSTTSRHDIAQMLRSNRRKFKYFLSTQIQIIGGYN